jgi:hypothetical protein
MTEQPTWLNNALLAAATAAQANTDVPITLCITPFSISFCRTDGLTYQHWTLDPVLLTALEDNPTESTASAVLPDVPAPLTITPSTQDEVVASPTLVPDPVQELLDDLNHSEPQTIPEFCLPPGDLEARVSLLTLQYINEGRRPRKRRLLQLRVAYHLGELHHEYPRTVWKFLGERVDRNLRAKIQVTIKRTYQIVQRIGLARLYGTQQLSTRRLRTLSQHDVTHYLLPGIQERSEDLALKDEGYVVSLDQSSIRSPDPGSDDLGMWDLLVSPSTSQRDTDVPVPGHLVPLPGLGQ